MFQPDTLLICALFLLVVVPYWIRIVRYVGGWRRMVRLGFSILKMRCTYGLDIASQHRLTGALAFLLANATRESTPHHDHINTLLSGVLPDYARTL